MKKTEGENISVLHTLGESLGIEDASKAGIKFLKPKILQALGFRAIKEAEAEVFTNLYLHETSVDLVHQQVLDQARKRKAIVMRFINDQGQQTGGYPIRYFGTEDEYKEGLIEDETGHFIGWQAIDGRIVKPEPNLHVQTISREQSVTARMSGLDNYSGERDIRIGGGFRMMLDRVSFDPPGYTFVTTMLFNDIGPRCANLASDYDNQVPRSTFVTTAKQNSEGLELIDKTTKDSSVEQILKSGKIDLVNKFIMNQFFHLNSGALSNFFNMMMNISPVEQQYMIDGIFSFRNDRIAILDVIDFDGEEVFDPSGSEIIKRNQLDPLRRLNEARLLIMRGMI